MVVDPSADGEIGLAEWQADLWVCHEPTFLRQAIPAHKPGEGAIGDCWRTCIACLIGAPTPTYVPHFMEQVEHLAPLGGWEALRLARTWLREELGIDLIEQPIEHAIASGAPYILPVRSKAGDWTHSVIAQGEQVIHDPSGIQGGYEFDDRAPDRNVDMLCTPYLPDPDTLIARWENEELAEHTAESGGPNDG